MGVSLEAKLGSLSNLLDHSRKGPVVRHVLR
jgi:hypothetical protein